MQFFDVIGIAFLVALALYEFAVYGEARMFAMRWNPRIQLNPRTGRLLVVKAKVNRTAADYDAQTLARYSRRSLLLHSWNASHYPFGDEYYKSWPYFALAILGTVLFWWAGLPILTAWGIGVCGGLTAFMSKYARDVAQFSADQSEFDAEVATAHQVAAIYKAQEIRQGIYYH